MADTPDSKPNDDLSALAWVHTELRRSLENAHKALRRHLKEADAAGRSDVDSADPAGLRTARVQLHQGAGALELVGLGAGAKLLRASEAAVQRMLSRPALVTEAHVHTLERASFALLDYLGRLLAGKRLSPVSLFPQYAAVQALAGADRVNPADLWEADFAWQDLSPEPGVAPRPADEAARGLMEAIVLRLMRQPGPEAWARLSDLCAELAAGEPGRGSVLWRLAAAFAEAEAAGALPQGDVHTKRVAARLLAQLRLASKRQDEPSERLAQDLLFFCAHARAADTPTPRLDAVRRAWRLEPGSAVDYERESLGRFDPAWIAQARKRVAGAKDVWSAVSGGEQHRLSGLAEQMALLGDSVDRLFPGGPVLSQALKDTAAHAVADGNTPEPTLAMEVATSVLYLDATLEDGDLDQPDLESRVRRMAERINDARGGAEPQPLESWMEELYRRVSDRQTMGSVVHELRVSLSEVEKQIDQYFRSPAQRELLIPVPNQLSAMRGVLSVLGMDQASQAVLHMRDDVDALASTEVDPQQAIKAGTFDRLADNLGALSFLIDMLSVQPQLAKSLFRFDAESGSFSAVMRQSERPSAFADLDAAPAPLEAQARELASNFGSLPTGDHGPALELLGQRALAADLPGVAGAVSSARRALERATDDQARQAVAAELAQTVDALLPPTAPPPAPVAAPTPATENLEDDAEMREIFLEEAREVIVSARQSLQQLRESADDVGELTTVRRAFHTLKGSSRMVGLRDYGEAAWACEQLYNARLAESPRMDPELDAFTEDALDHLHAWTEAIAAGDAAAHRSAPIVEAADLMRLQGQRVAIRAVAPAVEIDFSPAPAPDAVVELPVLELPVLGDVHDVSEATSAVSVDAALAEPWAPANEPHLPTTLAERVPDLPAASALDLSPPPEAPVFELDLGDGTPPPVLETIEFPPVEATAPALPDVGDVVELDFGDFDRVQSGLAPLPEQPLAQTPLPAEDPLSLGEVTMPFERPPEPFDEAPAVDEGPDFIELDLAGPAAPEAGPEPGPEPAALPDLVAAEVATLPLAAEAPVEDAVSDSDEQVKVIGELRIPIPLFNIYLNEADEQSRRLSTELAEWGIEHPRRPVPEAAVVLAHSLAGSSATVGYAELSGLARALEHTLLRSADQGSGSADDAALFTEAAEEIRRLLHQFAAGFLRPMAPGLLQRLAERERELAAAADRAGGGDGTEDADGGGDDEPAVDQTVPLAVQPTAIGGFHALEALPAAPVVGAQARADAFDDDDDIEAMDDLDAELFPIFEEEAEELLPQLQARLREWALQPSDAAAPAACMRTLHTFKGGARLAGAMRLGEMAHRLETAIEHLAAADTISAAQVDALLARADTMAGAYEALRRPGSAPPPAVPSVPAQAVPVALPQAVVEAVGVPAATPVSPVDTAAGAASPGAAADAVDTGPQVDWSRFSNHQAAPVATGDKAPGAGGAVRVRAGLLDRLVNHAGEVSITRARIDADVRQLHGAVNDLTDNLDRLRSQLRDLELQAESQISSRIEAAKAASQSFDPLEMDRFTRFQELTRMMAESVNDVATVQRNVQRTLQSTEDELAAQERLTRELQDDLLRTRMVEFESLADRLYRVVRQAGKDDGKQVRLDIVGGAIEVDRGVLERMVGPLEHLLRNSVAHGIESPEQRQAAGKEASGEIRLAVTQEGNEVSVECRDDGAGLKLERIRQRGLERGLLTPGQEPSDAELANLIFQPGFSTASEVTELAGRGVGLDVVRAEVNAMGGRIETASTPGQGTSFRLLLPLTTAVTQVVMLRCGELRVAVPSTLVEVVRRVPTAEVEQAYATGALKVGEQLLPFYWLGGLLQHAARGPALGRAQAVVLVRSAAQRVALHVDDVIGNQEVVVKHVGPQLARLPGLAGVTLLPSGAVALIYNPVALATLYGEAAQRRALGAAPVDEVGTPQSAVADEAVQQAPLVLVVDDSLTVRRVTQRLLVREGYRVALAKDGLDAIERLAEERPAVMLSDIEMPRMDGFDLVRNVRADSRLTGLPVIMITSRIAQKHRDYAAELGVDHYLGKPYSEEELLRLVAGYAGIEVAG
ncbi:Hpt domain-containing protein [Pseudorhodoferax sp.]|uniref:Hpt domain-containing protein n=1 Tax=Pseudorhodoferax sp. TaxID=1993553 RepID=UPI002DD658C3|nr:Hpt domain-containing protein [Pseudorhodoferax sp.]